MLSPALSGRSRVISYHLRAIGIYIWHCWLYLLSWNDDVMITALLYLLWLILFAPNKVSALVQVLILMIG
jgi:hypothetical protein